jgi:hypothetical protein
MEPPIIYTLHKKLLPRAVARLTTSNQQSVLENRADPCAFHETLR